MNAIWLAVIPAVIGLLGGVAAGLIPSLVLTERGRRVRAVRQAHELLKDVEDEPSRVHLKRALRADSERLADWSTELRYFRARRQFFASFFISTLFFAGLIFATVTAPETPDNLRQLQVIRVLAYAVAIIGTFFALRMLVLIFARTDLETQRMQERLRDHPPRGNPFIWLSERRKKNQPTYFTLPTPTDSDSPHRGKPST